MPCPWSGGGQYLNPFLKRLQYNIMRGGAWFGRLAPALQHNKVCVCVEERGGGRTFGAYGTHAEMWAAVEASPRPWHAYEIIREGDACKLYADIELYAPPELEEEVEKAAVRPLLECLRQAGGGGALTVLDGTRRVTLSADKAQALGLNAERVQKYSYHVIVQGHAFASAAAVKRRILGAVPPLISLLGDHATLRDLVERQPNVMDMSVYYKNKNFRTLGSCKADDATRTAFVRHPRLDETIGDEDVEALVTSNTEGLPRLEDDGDDAGSSVAKKRPRRGEPRLDALQRALRELMTRYGDTRTEVRYLQATNDSNELRWECRNTGVRPCLLTMNDHRSNHVMLWLQHPPNSSNLHDVYDVKYQCMSERCGRAAGIIGVLRWQNSRYEVETIFPPRLCPSARRPANFQARRTPLPEATIPNDGMSSEDSIMEDEDPESNSYERVKARFELRCFKVLSPFSYANIVDDASEPDFYTPTVIQQLYANLYYFERDAQTREWVKRRFIKKWMGDVRIRTVKRIVVDPQLPPRSLQPDVYNLWPGFAAAQLPPVPEADVAELIEPIVRHIFDVYANGDGDTTHFILDLFANLVQRPHMPSHVALSLYGRQGCGKGMPLTFLRERVLGKGCTFQTANPENDLLGRFQNGCVNRILIQVDEVKCLREYDDKLKNLITNDTVQFEKKGRDIITVRNLVNLIFTSNNENTLTVSTDDRRFVLLRCSEKYCGDSAYLTGLGRHMERAEVARAFYQFCLARDLRLYPYDFQMRRPITDYYLECQRSSIPVTSRFFSALVNHGECPERIGALALFQQYVVFHNAGHYKVLLTETAFGRNVRRIAGVTRLRQSKGQIYVLTPDSIKEHLTRHKEFDEDASLI